MHGTVGRRGATVMQGIWFTALGRTEFCDEPAPVCRPDTVLVRTLYSGLSNGTERNKLMGGNYHSGKYPDRIGYQHVSEVIEVGEQITQFAVGDRLFSATFPGHVPCFLLRESDLVVKLPDGFDPIPACLMGVASVSMHDARLAATGVADRVLVFGGGLIGLFAMQAARVLGAETVLVDRHQDRLELARQLGANHAIDNTGDAAWPALAELAPFDVLLECSGGDVLDRILGPAPSRGLMRKPSRAVFVAGRREVTIDFNKAFACKLQCQFTGHFDQDDLEQVLRLAGDGRILLAPLVREVVPIGDAIRIYDTLRDDKSALLGTVFDWTGDHGLG